MGWCTEHSGPPQVPPSLVVRSRLIALNKGCLWLPVGEPSFTTTVYFEQGQRAGEGRVIAAGTWLYILLLTPHLPLSWHVTNADWEGKRERQCAPVLMCLHTGFFVATAPTVNIWSAASDSISSWSLLLTLLCHRLAFFIGQHPQVICRGFKPANV